MKKLLIIPIIILTISLLAFTGCADKEEDDTVSADATRSTKGLNEFPMGEHITLPTPEGFAKPDEYVDKIENGFFAEISFKGKESADKTLIVYLCPKDSEEYQRYKARAKKDFKGKADTVYEEMNGEIGKAYFSYKKGEEVSYTLDELGNEEKQKKEPELCCFCKTEDGLLYAEYDNSAFDEEKETVTVYPIGEDEYVAFKEYIKSIKFNKEEK